MDSKILCLGVLSRGPASGYEIKKAFEEGPYAHIHAASFGSVYPALTRLAADGLVDCTEMEQEKRPDKKLYSITAAGRAELERALQAPPGPDKVRSDFLFVLSLAELLPPELLADLIDGRIAWYEETLERMKSCPCHELPAGRRFVHGLGLAVYSAARDYLTANRDALLAEVVGATRQVAE